MFLTIFTPAYNRAHLLPRLYESLKAQTVKDFEWIVVDDGSTDNTEELMNLIIANDNDFPVRYVKQKNGGKHRAFNKGVSLADGDWFKCLDSDDWLLPDAVESIKPYCDALFSEKNFCSVTALRVQYPSKEPIGHKCNYDVLDSDFFSYRYILNVVGDRCEVIKTSAWKEFPFPEFEGENFLAEGGVMALMAAKYKTRYVNLDFQYCEYQAGGLTDTFQEKLKANPQGALFNAYCLFKNPKSNFRNKMRFLSIYKGIRKTTGVNEPYPNEMKPYLFLLPLLSIYRKVKGIK